MLTIAAYSDQSDMPLIPTWAIIPLAILAIGIIVALLTPKNAAPTETTQSPATRATTCGQRKGHYYRKTGSQWECVECGDVVVVERAPYDQEATA